MTKIDAKTASVKALRAEATRLSVAGRSSMSVEELRSAVAKEQEAWMLLDAAREPVMEPELGFQKEIAKLSDHPNFPHSGLFKVRLQLRDDSGAVIETIEAEEHRCSVSGCIDIAHCEGCGGVGSNRILLIGSTEDGGMSIFTCYPCLGDDESIRTEREPSRCPNSWHRMNELTALRPCPECPAR